MVCSRDERGPIASVVIALSRVARFGLADVHNSSGIFASTGVENLWKSSCVLDLGGPPR